MAILKIARMGHPILRRVAEPIGDPGAPEVHRLIDDMSETMVDAMGAGLAAPQVHVPLRLVMFRVGEDRAEEADEADQPLPLTVLINPVLEFLTEELAEDWEACLSVPGLRGRVPRVTRLRYRGLAPDGSEIDRVAEGFHARVVQHECDHLDGILYPQRMSDLSQLTFDTEYHYFRAEAIARTAGTASGERAGSCDPEAVE